MGGKDMQPESNVDIIKEYGKSIGIKDEDLDDYARRTLIMMANM